MNLFRDFYSQMNRTKGAADGLAISGGVVSSFFSFDNPSLNYTPLFLAASVGLKGLVGLISGIKEGRIHNDNEYRFSERVANIANGTVWGVIYGGLEFIGGYYLLNLYFSSLR